MAVETAEDLASFFDDDEFAEAALYQPPSSGSDPVACLVIIDLGQGRRRFEAGSGMDGQRAVTSERHLWAMAGDSDNQLADVRRDGVFTLDRNGEVLRVAGLPKLDETGHLWSVDLVKVG